MSKNLSEKYYQENKERLQRKAHEIFLKKKKEKSKNKVMNVTKISQKMKHKTLLSIGKSIIE